jgi:hypothetical protein
METAKEEPKKRDHNEVVNVSNSLVRCPYCHDDIAPDSPGWVACQSCLARHHDPCWREAGNRCGTCGASRELVPKLGLSDAELARLVRHGRRAEVVAELRGRGLSEQHAQAFYDGARLMLRDPTPRARDRALSLIFTLQAVALVLCTIAALGGAAVGAFSGLTVLIAGVLALLRVAHHRSSGRVALWALANVAAIALGPITITAFDIGPWDKGHPALLSLGALVSGASFFLGWWWLKGEDDAPAQTP